MASAAADTIVGVDDGWVVDVMETSGATGVLPNTNVVAGAVEVTSAIEVSDELRYGVRLTSERADRTHELVVGTGAAAVVVGRGVDEVDAGVGDEEVVGASVDVGAVDVELSVSDVEVEVEDVLVDVEEDVSVEEVVVSSAAEDAGSANGVTSASGRPCRFARPLW